MTTPLTRRLFISLLTGATMAKDSKLAPGPAGLPSTPLQDIKPYFTIIGGDKLKALEWMKVTSQPKHWSFCAFTRSEGAWNMQGFKALQGPEGGEQYEIIMPKGSVVMYLQNCWIEPLPEAEVNEAIKRETYYGYY